MALSKKGRLSQLERAARDMQLYYNLTEQEAKNFVGLPSKPSKQKITKRNKSEGPL